MERIHARCVGGPKNGIVYDLEVSPDDKDGINSMKAHGGTVLSDRYRLIEETTTTGERILVYIGEPRDEQLSSTERPTVQR